MTNGPARRTRRLLALCVCAAALAAGGCGRNRAGSLLVPTGIRPAPANPTGALFGFVAFDPSNYPGLDAAPFPPATVQLFLDGAGIATATVGGGSRRFDFTSLVPGDYTVIVRSHVFRTAGFGPFRVVDDTRDTGDLALAASTDSIAGSMFLIGTAPGFTTDELQTFSTIMDQNTLGVWSYPNSLFPPTAVPAGTWRMKFVTDPSSTPGHLIGWGGDSTQVLDVPLTDVPARYGTAAASDLKLHFATSGAYLFTFDERRLTFSITPAPSPAPHARAARPAGRSR